MFLYRFERMNGSGGIEKIGQSQYLTYEDFGIDPNDYILIFLKDLRTGEVIFDAFRSNTDF